MHAMKPVPYPLLQDNMAHSGENSEIKQNIPIAR